MNETNKGKFGLSLVVYPVAAFACIILKQPILCAAICALAIFLERDEWSGRQCLQAVCLAGLLWIFGAVVPWLAALCVIPVLNTIVLTIANVLHVVVYMAAIFFSILAIMRTSKGQEANLPIFSELAYRAYGKRQPLPMPTIPGVPQETPDSGRKD